MKKAGILIFMSLFAFSLSGCGDEGAKVTNLEIENKPTELIVGDSIQLEAKYTPNDLKNVSLTWESDDDSIITVDNGNITGEGTGEATVTVHTKNKNAEDSVTINVREEIKADSISLDTNEISLDKNDTYELNAVIQPENVDNADINWTSSNESVATVADGKIKAVDYGEAVVTAETSNGKTVQCNVKVEEFNAAKLEEEVAKQPLCVTSTEYFVQSTQWKTLYPDMLSAVIKNNSDKDIKNAVIAFVAWDSNNLPVKIEGQYDFNGGDYIVEVNYNDINLVPGASYGDNSGYSLNCMNGDPNIAKFKAIVVSYTTFDGETWKNPLYNKFKDIYEDKKLES